MPICRDKYLTNGLFFQARVFIRVHGQILVMLLPGWRPRTLQYFPAPSINPLLISSCVIVGRADAKDVADVAKICVFICTGMYAMRVIQRKAVQRIMFGRQCMIIGIYSKVFCECLLVCITLPSLCFFI
jgi:hypothetical protein